LKKNLLTYKNHFVPDISANYNCLIINVIHFVIEGVVEDDFFVVARQFGYSCTDGGIYNLVIIVVWEVKSAIVVVVVDIVVDHNHRVPGVEESVGDDSSKGRTADDIVSIEVAAVNTVVEVVGSSVIIYGSDVVRNVDMTVIVVVIRVYVGSVRCGAVVRTVSIMVSPRTRLVATVVGVAVAILTRTRDGLRLSFTFTCISALFSHSSSSGV
jgi:hypothetical protein